MAATPERPKLLAIVGPTASGKSALAMQVAALMPSEIICVDSRTIYKGMDIGTAKPTSADRKKVPHWGLDLIKPGDDFSAARYKRYANAKIKEIQARNKLPILVGGSGLYMDSVLYDFRFGPASTADRQKLEAKTLSQLTGIINEKGWELPENTLNKRHLVRTIERHGIGGGRSRLPQDSLVIGLRPPDESLRNNITRRAGQMFKQGIIMETKGLCELYGRDALVQTGGIIYRICIRLIDGEISEQTAATLFKSSDWQYARRQKTWYKKNNDIIWFTDIKSAYIYLEKLLNN